MGAVEIRPPDRVAGGEGFAPVDVGLVDRQLARFVPGNLDEAIADTGAVEFRPANDARRDAVGPVDVLAGGRKCDVLRQGRFRGLDEALVDNSAVELRPADLAAGAPVDVGAVDSDPLGLAEA